MERKSRSELIKIIESQGDQLGRYETRLRDVVHAYKNLLQEKEALDASIKVLTTAQQVTIKHASKSSKKKSDNEILASEGNHKEKDKATAKDNTSEKLCPIKEGIRYGGIEVQDHPLGGKQEEEKETRKGQETKEQDEKEVEEDEDDNQDGCDAASDFKDKVMTLTSTLNTVMEQKAKMEANYQADKKKMMQDYETKHKEMAEEREKMIKKIEELDSQVKEFKLRTRQEQRAREEEENNHALMLRELQLLFAKERMAKEDLEQQLDDAKDKLESSKFFPEGRAQEYEIRIAKLKTELEELKERLKKIEEVSSRPSPLLLKLQEEMAEMKRGHANAVISEQRRANEAEERLRMITSVEEDRVADLEAKLSELSEVVGNYEKLRYQDQQVILKLKERLQQLDVKNTALSLHSPTGDMPDNNIQTVEEIEVLRDQVCKLRTVLKMTVEKSEKSVEQELEGFSKSELESILNSDPTHRACQQELKQLKDEFERYKSKTQSLHRNKSFKELTSQLENLDKVKARNSSLEKRLKEFEEYSHLKEREQNELIATLQTDLHGVEELCKRDKEDAELIYRHKLSELEKQVIKQRERTLELVAEKDAEIDSLRNRSPSASPSRVGAGASMFSYPRRFMDSALISSEGLEPAEGTSSPDTNAAVYQLLTRQAGVASGEPGMLIHYAQQQARREAVNTDLRREKNELEDDLRECTLREAKISDQCDTLKEEIRKLERDRSRESANLEYLKNIVLRFMLTTSYSVKEQMITAIATILQFSPKELTRVKRMHAGTWWGASS